jgi:hypothetical protein
MGDTVILTDHIVMLRQRDDEKGMWLELRGG